jgi:hypothetical protein
MQIVLELEGRLISERHFASRVYIHPISTSARQIECYWLVDVFITFQCYPNFLDCPYFSYLTAITLSCIRSSMIL